MINTQQNYATLVQRVLKNSHQLTDSGVVALNYLQNLSADQNGLNQTQSVLADLESGKINSYIDSLGLSSEIDFSSVDSYFYQALAGEVLQGSNLAYGFADLVGHSVSVNSFIDPNDSYVQAYVKTLKENGYLKDTMTFDQKVLSIYNHVIQNFDYVSDPKDDWNFASETILAGKGDCEDLSVLFMSLVYAVGYEEGLSSTQLSKKMEGVTGSLIGFGEHVYVEYKTDDGQTYAFDPSLRLEGAVQNYNQLKTADSKRSEMKVYFTFNEQYTTVFGEGAQDYGVGALYLPSSRIVTDHPGIQNDIQDLFKNGYLSKEDTDDQRFLKLYNWFASHYEYISEDGVTQPPAWAAYDLKAGNAKDLTFLFTNYLLEAEKQAGTPTVDIASKYQLTKIEQSGQSYYFLKVKDESGSEHWVDFSGEVFPKQIYDFESLEVLPVGEGLKISKTVASMTQLPVVDLKINEGVDYSFSINDPLLIAAPKQSFVSSFGLEGFVAQKDKTALSNGQLSSLANWDPYFHPSKHNNINQPRIGTRVQANDDGWEIPRPEFEAADYAGIANAQADKAAAQASAAGSYYQSAVVFQKSAQIELAQMSDFNSYIISDQSAFGYLSIDQVSFNQHRQNLQRYLGLYQVMANIAQAMNSSHGTVVEALGNGVQAYKQMDVKSIVSQEANYISRGCNEMLSDLNNVINARNQLLEAAFSKWINANQKYINKMGIGDILGLFAKQIGLSIALFAAATAAFIAITAGFSAAFGLIAGFFTAPAGFALLAATIAGAIATGAALAYAVVKFGPAADIAPPKYAGLINATMAIAIAPAAIAAAAAISGEAAIPYAGVALAIGHLLSFIGAYFSVIMSGVQLGMEAVKLETAAKTTEFNDAMKNAKLNIAMQGETLLDVEKNNKPKGNSNHPLFEIMDSAYDAMPSGNQDRGQKGDNIDNGYKQTKSNRYLQSLEQIDRKQNLFRAYVKVFQDKYSSRALIVQELSGLNSPTSNQSLTAIADQEFSMMKEAVNTAYQLEQQYVAQHNKWKQAEYAENKLSWSFYLKLGGFAAGTALSWVPVVGGPGVAMAVAATAAEWRNYYINDDNDPRFNIYSPTYGNLGIKTEEVNTDLFSVTRLVQSDDYIATESDNAGNWMVAYDRVRNNRKTLYQAANKMRALIMLKTHVSECRNLVHQEMTQNSGRKYGQGLIEIYDRERAFAEQMLNAKLEITKTKVQTHNSENAQTQNFLKSNVQVLGALGLMALAEADNRSDLNIKLGSRYAGSSLEYVGGNVDSVIKRGGYQNLDFDVDPENTGIGYDPFLTFADGRNSYYSSSGTTVTPDSTNLTELLFQINEHILTLSAFGAVKQSIREARRLVHQELTGIGGADTADMAKSTISAEGRRLNQDFMSIVNMTNEIANLTTMYATAKKEQSRNVIKALTQVFTGVITFIFANINVAVSMAGLASALLDFLFATIDLANMSRWQNEMNKQGRLNRFTAKTGQNKMEDKTKTQIQNLINAGDEGESAIAQAELKRMNKLKEQLAKLNQAKAGSKAGVRGALGKATAGGGNLFSEAVSQEGSLADNLGNLSQSNFAAKDQFESSEGSVFGKAFAFFNSSIGLGLSGLGFAKGVLEGKIKFNGGNVGLGEKIAGSFSLFGKDGDASILTGGEGTDDKGNPVKEGAANSSSIKNQLKEIGIESKLGVGAFLIGGLALRLVAKQTSLSDFANDTVSNKQAGVDQGASASARQLAAVQGLEELNKRADNEGNQKLIERIENGTGDTIELTRDQLPAVFGKEFDGADLSDPITQNKIREKAKLLTGRDDAFTFVGDKLKLSGNFDTSGTMTLQQINNALLALNTLKNGMQILGGTLEKNDSEERLKKKQASIEKVIARMAAAGVPLHTILEAIAYAISEEQREFDRNSRLTEALINTVGSQFATHGQTSISNGKLVSSYQLSEQGGIGAWLTQGANAVGGLAKGIVNEYILKKLPTHIQEKYIRSKLNEAEAKRIFAVLDQGAIDRLKRLDPDKAAIAQKAKDDFSDFQDGKIKSKEFTKRMEQYFNAMGFAMVKPDVMLKPEVNATQNDALAVFRAQNISRTAVQSTTMAVPVEPRRQTQDAPATQAGSTPVSVQPERRDTPSVIPAASRPGIGMPANAQPRTEGTRGALPVTASTTSEVNSFDEAMNEFSAITAGKTTEGMAKEMGLDLSSKADVAKAKTEGLKQYDRLFKIQEAKRQMALQLEILKSERSLADGNIPFLRQDITNQASAADVAFGDLIVSDLQSADSPIEIEAFKEKYKKFDPTQNQAKLQGMVDAYSAKKAKAANMPAQDARIFLNTEAKKIFNGPDGFSIKDAAETEFKNLIRKDIFNSDPDNKIPANKKEQAVQARVDYLKTKTNQITTLNEELRQIQQTEVKASMDLLHTENKLRSVGSSLNEGLVVDNLVNKFTGWTEVGTASKMPQVMASAAQAASGFGTVAFVTPDLDGKPRYPQTLREHAEALNQNIHKLETDINMLRAQNIPSSDLKDLNKKLQNLREQLNYQALAESYTAITSLNVGFNIDKNMFTEGNTQQDALINNINQVLQDNHENLAGAGKKIYAASENINPQKPFSSLKNDMLNYLNSKTTAQSHIEGVAVFNLINTLEKGGKISELSSQDYQTLKTMDERTLRALERNPDIKKSAELTINFMLKLNGEMIRTVKKTPSVPLSWEKDNQSSTSEINIRKASEWAVKKMMGNQFNTDFSNAKINIEQLNLAITRGRFDKVRELVGDDSLRTPLLVITELCGKKFKAETGYQDYVSNQASADQKNYIKNNQIQRGSLSVINDLNAQITFRARALIKTLDNENNVQMAPVRAEIKKLESAIKDSEEAIQKNRQTIVDMKKVLSSKDTSVVIGDQIYFPGNPAHQAKASTNIQDAQVHIKSHTTLLAKNYTELDKLKTQLKNSDPTELVHEDLKKAMTFGDQKVDRADMSDWQKSLAGKMKALNPSANVTIPNEAPENRIQLRRGIGAPSELTTRRAGVPQN